MPSFLRSLPRPLNATTLVLVALAVPLSAQAPASPSGTAETPKPQRKPRSRPRREEIPSAVVVVSATRTERTEKETPSAVSVLAAEQLEAQQVRKPTELVRFEPGVEVGAKPDRQGATSFTIRGIGGNRVQILVDGVRLPDGPEAGRNFSRDLVDLDSVKRVEILRGPSSALYGADALGGVVTYTTKDASDYLEGDRHLFSSLRSTYTSVDEGRSATLTAAGRQGAWEGLLLGTLREAGEVRPALGTPNPMTTRSRNVLGKVLFRPAPGHTLRFGAQYLERNGRDHLVSLEGSSMGSPTLVLDARGRDQNRRAQFSLEHVFEDESAFFQRLEWRVHQQTSDLLERTQELRLTGPALRIRDTDYRFHQEILGLRGQAERRFNVGGWAHRLLFGAEMARTETGRPYDRTELNPATGAVTRSVGGSTYPSKIMPDTTTRDLGLFVQAEVLDPTGCFSVIPGLRVDRQRQDPHPDADFQRSNTANRPVTSFAGTAWSPRLGVLLRLDATWTGYLQYAQAFRNPPYDNTNIAFTMRMGPMVYEVLPSPGLKRERSEGLEMGLRGDGSSWDVGVSVFLNTYRDFITNVTVGVNPDTGATQFQFQNLQEVRIRGVEFKGGCAFGEGFKARVALALAEGDDTSRALPLTSIAPPKLVLGLGYRRGERWGWDLLWTGVGRKERLDVVTPLESMAALGQKDPFRSPGYATLDLLAQARLDTAGRWKLQAGCFNALNRVHWRWEDVMGMAAADTVTLARYTQPGRTFSVSLGYSWR